MKSKFIKLSLISLLMIGVAFASYNLSPKSVYETKVGKITQIDISERQAQLDKIVEEGMMNVNYSTSITVKDGVSTDFNIKNIENNNYPIKFRIINEDGDSLYESGLIDLGYELNGLELSNALSKGTHSCRIFIGYAEEGNVESSFPLTIEVL